MRVGQVGAVGVPEDSGVVGADVIALVVLASTHARVAALTVGAIFLLITLASDLIEESRQ